MAQNGSSQIAFVAELSGNHNGSLERLLSLVEASAQAGATHVKLQTYTADTMTLPIKRPPFTLPTDHPLWPGRDLYSLYVEASTPWEWHSEAFDLARSSGLVPFSSPFDKTAVEFLENLRVELYKIASLEIGDIPLLKEVGATGKPVVISIGAASEREIEQAVTTLDNAGAGSITILVCTSSYPAEPEDANLRRIETLRQQFEVDVGLSDHTLGIGVPVAATALGATMIEKHLTLDRADGGVDSGFSLSPSEFEFMVKECRVAEVALGSPALTSAPSEETSLGLKRSIFVTQNVVAGDAVTESNIACIRPAGGLAPGNFEAVLGRTFSSAAAPGTALTWDLLDG